MLKEGAVDEFLETSNLAKHTEKDLVARWLLLQHFVAQLRIWRG